MLIAAQPERRPGAAADDDIAAVAAAGHSSGCADCRMLIQNANPTAVITCIRLQRARPSAPVRDVRN